MTKQEESGHEKSRTLLMRPALFIRKKGYNEMKKKLPLQRSYYRQDVNEPNKSCYKKIKSKREKQVCYVTAPRAYKKPVSCDTGFLQRMEDRMKKKFPALHEVRYPFIVTNPTFSCYKTIKSVRFPVVW